MEIKFRCMVCGSEVRADTGLSGITCSNCGVEIAVPYRGGEERYDEANIYRQMGDFPMATAVYDEILEEYSKDAEAHFGRFLSRYTVRYRKNPFSGTWEPECMSPPQMPVMEDGDYLRAMELSGPMKRVIYRQMAEEIDRICQRGEGLGREEFLFCHRLSEEQRGQMEKELLGGRRAGEKEPENNSQRQPEQENSRLSEAEKTKIAVLEKRIEGIEKAIRTKQSAWLRWERWDKGFSVICMVIFLPSGCF